MRCRIPHPLHPERHGQAVGDGRLDVLACEDAVQADECNEKQIEGELALDVDGVDDDLAGNGRCSRRRQQAARGSLTKSGDP